MILGLMDIMEPSSLQSSIVANRIELEELISRSQLLDNVEDGFEADADKHYTETPANIVADAIHDLVSYNDCLMDLSSLIGSLPFSVDIEEDEKPPHQVPIDLNALSLHTQRYCLRIADRFPHVSPHLVQRLGEANTRRDRRLVECRRLDKRSQATGHADTHITESSKSTHPSSVFDREPTESHEADDQFSQTSLASFSTKFASKKSTSGRAGRSRVPKMPESFKIQECQCKICGQTCVPFATRSEWK